MLFTSPIFVFIFLPIVILVYLLINPRFRNGWLLISSIVFYSWSGIQYMILLLALVIVNYIFGLMIDVIHKKQSRKTVLIASLVVNFGTLAFFKYFNFFVSNIENLIHIANPSFTFNAPNIPLPVGISFFTFQIVSYIIDVYWRKIKPQKNILVIALYMTLFPPFIAGPIIRYFDIESQILNRKLNVNMFAEGVERFCYGFAKKILIANNMGEIAEVIINQPQDYSTPACWLGIICYALQIYFDFSGYSDMVIGMGKMFGFTFLENFNYPYISRSIREFWRRWHISLSSWFKDYLYIPLGGNRKGTLYTYRNLLLVFLLTGLWHGASWNFVIWGVWHGLFLVIERIFSNFFKKVPSLFAHIYTVLIILVGWVLFRIESFEGALKYLRFMFIPSLKNWDAHLTLMDREFLFYLFAGIIISTPAFPKVRDYIVNKIEELRFSAILQFANLTARNIFALLLLALSALYMVSASFNPFIYFRF
jgi:alginate O-acetyltransferase complex protein AlgI